jgi:hypothetical protein
VVVNARVPTVKAETTETPVAAAPEAAKEEKK